MKELMHFADGRLMEGQMEDENVKHMY